MRRPIRQLVLTLLLIATVGSTYAQKTFTPLQLSEKLDAISTEMFQKTEAWTDAFPKALNTGQYAQLKPHRENLQQFIETNIKYVTSLKEVNNSKPLQEAFIAFLTYEKKVVEESFTPFEGLKADTSVDELKKLVAKMSTMAEKEPVLLAKLSEAKAKYALENGFTVEEEE